MARIIKKLTVDVAAENTFQSIIAKQGDTDSRFLMIQLANEGENIVVESTSTVVINALREDNESNVFGGTVNDDGTVTVPITSWMLELDGIIQCDVSVYESERKLTCMTFTISVEAATYTGNGENVTEDENYNPLITLIAECQSIKNDEAQRVIAENSRVSAESQRNNAEESRVNAENERSLAEQNRCDAEINRNKAENSRVEAEQSRIASENDRNEAEQIRQTNVATTISNADAATDRANNVAQLIENGLAANNISYDGTESGLDSTNVKNAIDEIVLKFGNIVAVESWKSVQKIVRQGLAPKIFKIGEQLTCNKGNTELVWDIIGFDHDVPVDNEFIHSMTLQLHDCQGGKAFDESEAIIYAESEMSAGTYNFQIDSQPWYTADSGETFQFTLTNPVPAGGQIVLDTTYNQGLDGKTVKVYESSISTDIIETATISKGNGGTALGKTDGTVANVNHFNRAVMGYNRWIKSALRQWLNSDSTGNNWWQPQNVFDRPSSFHGTDGFLSDLDDDFLAVIGEVTKRTAKNTAIDGGGYEDCTEKMFLLARSEVYGGEENNVNEGEPYPYYSEYSDLSGPSMKSDNNRIKYRNGDAQHWWLRTCGAGSSHTRYVTKVGDVANNGAKYGYCVAPACNIV